MRRYGTTPEHIAKIAQKNHRHAVNNPYAQSRTAYNLEQIATASKVYDPLTKLQCCPTSDGAAAAILVSESFAQSHGLLDQCVEILAMALATDTSTSTFEGNRPDPMDIVGFSMTQRAARDAYRQAGIAPSQAQVAEVHDCFSANELITYEALSFCSPGDAGKSVDNNEFTFGGRIVVNPSGGLIGKGHPLGATGVAQCTELVWQLRGNADRRQVTPLPEYALQHNLGLGGACVVAIYKKFTRKAANNCLTSDPSELEAWELRGSPPETRPTRAVKASKL
jgi:sterol carrier protein 2